MAKKYNAPNFSAHITLFSGIGEYNNAKNAINECRFLKKIHVNVMGIGDSNYLWKTVFLNIKNDSALNRLNELLTKALPKTKYQFNPHISLIYKKMRKPTRTTLKRDLKIRKKFTFDKITIIRSSKNVSAWKKIKSIKLGNKLTTYL